MTGACLGQIVFSPRAIGGHDAQHNTTAGTDDSGGLAHEFLRFVGETERDHDQDGAELLVSEG